MSRATRALIPFWLTQEALTPAHGSGSASTSLADAAEALYFAPPGSAANALAVSPAALTVQATPLAGLAAAVGTSGAPDPLVASAATAAGLGVAGATPVAPDTVLLAAGDASGSGTGFGTVESPNHLVLAAGAAAGDVGTAPSAAYGPRTVRVVTPDLRIGGRGTLTAPAPLHVRASPAPAKGGAGSTPLAPTPLHVRVGVSRGTGVRNPSAAELAVLFDLMAA